jgi:hypothetical protein
MSQMTGSHGAIRSTICTFAALGLLLGVATAALAANYEVIVTKAVPATSFSKADLKAVFLGEKVKWDNSKYIKVVLPEDPALLKEFLQQVVGKTPSQYDNHWQNLVFTGKAAMPRSFADAGKLMEYVAGHAGAIGVVLAGQADASVKTISIK